MSGEISGRVIGRSSGVEGGTETGEEKEMVKGNVVCPVIQVKGGRGRLENGKSNGKS